MSMAARTGSKQIPFCQSDAELPAPRAHHLILIFPKSHDCYDNVNGRENRIQTNSILPKRWELPAPRAHHLILIFPKSHDCYDNVNGCENRIQTNSILPKRCGASRSARTSSDPDISQISRLLRQCQWAREQDPNKFHFAKAMGASCSARTSSDPDISQISRLLRQCQWLREQDPNK